MLLEYTDQMWFELCFDFKFDVILFMERIEVDELLPDIKVQFFCWKDDTGVEIRIDVLIYFINIPDFTHIIRAYLPSFNPHQSLHTNVSQFRLGP